MENRFLRIGLYHGYELKGSGSNEFTAYLARSLSNLGHQVHIICRERDPERFEFVKRALSWDVEGRQRKIFERPGDNGGCVLHRLPEGPVTPVYVTDKQRAEHVKSFLSLSDEDLAGYHRLNESLLRRVLAEFPLDILHANHLIYQPVAALLPCQENNVPLIIYPHGSAIEYTVKPDARYQKLALLGIQKCAGLIIGNTEVRDRIIGLFPDHRKTILSKTQIVGVGVDTSLFAPVSRSDRRRSIKSLIEKGIGGGKKPDLSLELRDHLKRGDLEATRSYWDRYDHALPDADAAEHLERIPWEENILLFVGALTVGKGVQTLITALPAILESHPKTHLVVVGSGTYREVLEALVFALETGHEDLLLRLCAQGKDLDRNELTGPWEDVQVYLSDSSRRKAAMRNSRSLSRHVHFLGRMDHPRLKHLFPCADLAVFPSVVPEAYPLVLMESLANGVLPVVSYSSGFKEGLDELKPFLDESVLIRMKIPVDPGLRVETLASNINGLLKNPVKESERQRLRKLAEERFDWNRRAAQMAEAYSQILNTHYV